MMKIVSNSPPSLLTILDISKGGQFEGEKEESLRKETVANYKFDVTIRHW